MFFEVNVQCLDNLLNIHNGFPFLPERTKIEKVKKLIRNIKQALKNGLVMKKLVESSNVIKKFC